jgi:hypothetical protein
MGGFEEINHLKPTHNGTREKETYVNPVKVIKKIHWKNLLPA